ncbi:carbohydrate ABC transporter permease [Cohnella silvisoli]|uniref:Sugar ABC transporter permease n=1 Tax=Cohnella silvisoli TaxID=2873699 RepID=A0ABV1KRU8_9BACL|nr:sugar ABC transporter permease [Cohnella silvisoli]MCD9022010.1 sugar ABC transporter permease [Cohnella silvisoli]
MSKLTRQNYPYYLLLPGLLIFFCFFAYPSVSGFYYAFVNWDGIQVRGFTGWDNFRNLIDRDDFGLVFYNTFLFTAVTTFFKIALGLLLAVLANMTLRFSKLLRSVLFLPVILSYVAVGLVFSAIFEPDRGLLNQLLTWVGMGGWTQSWLTNEHLVMFSISAAEIWKTAGFCMMLFLAGLQTIPKDWYEAAQMDGAGAGARFRYITLPALRPVIQINVILTLISGLKVFDLVYTMTGGGPSGASEVISTVVYDSFSKGYYGEGTAANLLLFVLILVVVIFTHKLITKNDKETSHA